MPATPPAGTAHLEFVRSGSDSVLARSFATSPVKILATGRQRAAWVYVATLGGGLVGGDEIHVTARLDDRARALLATQGALKVYRSLRPAKQALTCVLGAGSLLAVLPDPVVCFADADFTQSQRYDLSTDASLVLVDWMTSGRHAAGERWAFSRYESRTAIRRDGRPVLNDAVVLAASELDSVGGRMGRFDVLLTAVLAGPLVSEPAERLRADIATQPIVKDADMVMSASKLGDGATMLRIAGVSVEQVGRFIRDSFRFLCPLLGDDPWSRKW
jgi:urease accessory protein